MRRLLLRNFVWLVIAVSSAGVRSSSASETQTRPHPPPPPLANATLAPALKAAAEREHIKLFTIDPATTTALNDDYSVLWVGASDAKGKRQWLIQLRRSAATAAEQKANRNRERTKYLSWGPVVTFKSDVQALDLWIAGPVKMGEGEKPDAVAPTRRVRVLVPSDYLRLGLDDSLRVDQHMRRRFEAIRKEDPKFNGGGIYALDKPIKPENVGYSKPIAEKIQFTPEMERAWVGGYVALEAFYNLANEVPEIEAIASIAVDKPSIFKLAKLATGTQFMTYFGGPDTKSVDPAKLGLLPVALEAFDAPFSFGFGKDPIVSGGMVVTRPLPPLDTTAGILGMVATHPKDATSQVHAVVISGVRGAAPGAVITAGRADTNVSR